MQSNPLFFLFFSSRRRHTRCGRDWSSDVCSSDLKASQALNEESKKALTTLSAQIDLLAEQGVDGLSIMPESALLKSLLYSVATAENRTEQIRVLQKQYKLDQALEKPAAETRIENKVLQKFIASIVEQIDTQHAKTA